MDVKARQAALRWFDERAGSEVGWKDLRLADGTLLATRAKGIYKPEGASLALSVSERLGSPYLDEQVSVTNDGGWRYRYRQEEMRGRPAADLYTNQGLARCIQSRDRVGVLIQASRGPSTYRVLGSAFVTSWSQGVFLLEGAPAAADSQGQIAPPWWPQTEDTRERARALVVCRYGQPTFRAELIAAYGGACALSDTAVPAVLEAAHIDPYLGRQSDHITNGVLLRSDIHALFDLGLIAVSADSMTVVIADKLRRTDYASLEGRLIRLPARADQQPSRAALSKHRRWTGLSFVCRNYQRHPTELAPIGSRRGSDPARL